MPLAELMSQIQELPKIDKLRLMQFLATELVKEEEVPLNLAAGTRLRIIVESVLPNEVKPHKTFLQTAQSLKLQGKPDWSEKIDQYLYGETLSEQ
jgi:hypothetical protein